MKTFIKAIISFVISIIILMVLVFAPPVQLAKNFETKIYKSIVMRKISGQVKDFVGNFNLQIAKTEMYIKDIVSFFSFKATENKSVTQVQSPEVIDLYLRETLKSFSITEELFALLVIDGSEKIVASVFTDLCVQDKILRSFDAEKKQISNVHNANVFYSQELEALVFFSECLLENYQVIFFVDSAVFFPASKSYSKIVLHNQGNILAFLQGRFLDATTENTKKNIESLLSNHWRDYQNTQNIFNDGDAYFLVSTKAKVGDIGFIIDSNFFKLSFLQKVLFLSLLFIVFSFFIFMLLNLIPHTKYFNDKEIEELSLEVFYKCFIEDKNSNAIAILLEKQNYIDHILKNLHGTFDTKFLKKNKEQIEKKLESIWKNIFDFKMKIIANKNNFENFQEYNLKNSSGLKVKEQAMEIDDSTIEKDKVYSLKLNAIANIEGNKDKQTQTVSTSQKKKSFLQKAIAILEKNKKQCDDCAEAIFIGEYENYIPQCFLQTPNIPNVGIETKISASESYKDFSRQTITETDDGMFEINDYFTSGEKNKKFENLVRQVLYKNE